MSDNYEDLKLYKKRLEEEIVEEIRTKIEVVGEMLSDEKQHTDLAIILNTETVLSASVKEMAVSFSKEVVNNIDDAKRVYSNEKYYFIRVGELMGSDSGMPYSFDELDEVTEQMNERRKECINEKA